MAATATHRNSHSEEEESLCRSYPYFVQSPGSSPAPPPPPLSLSLSSSRGSNKLYYTSHLNLIAKTGHGDAAAAVNINGEHCLEDDEEDDERRVRGWSEYLSFGYSNSGWWILVQLCWRFLFSITVAVLVFYAAVKPPPPSVSVKVARIGQFRLGEGVDGSGVTTKVLNCNCSMNVIIDNKSKLFDLHIHGGTPSVEMGFGHFHFATSQMSQGKKEYAKSNDITTLKLSVGTKNKEMYGGGREMEEMLESGKGLPLQVKVRLKTSYHVVWGVFHPKFEHEADCLVVLANKYDKKRRTQVYTSACVINDVKH